jgi:anti-sigma factor RsiW
MMTQEEGQPFIQDITCQEIAQWASAYLDDHVGDERNRQIAVHLAICAGCETYVKQIATVRDVLRVLPTAVKQPADSRRLRHAFVSRTRRSASDE